MTQHALLLLLLLPPLVQAEAPAVEAADPVQAVEAGAAVPVEVAVPVEAEVPEAVVVVPAGVIVVDVATVGLRHHRHRLLLHHRNLDTNETDTIEFDFSIFLKLLFFRSKGKREE